MVPPTETPKKRKRDGPEVTESHSKRRRPRSSRHGANGAQNEPIEEQADAQKPQNGTPARKTPKKKAHGASTESAAAADTSRTIVSLPESSSWQLSAPMGGRMADVDPILTADQRYLILTYNTTIQVYTTADSLLVRRIPVPRTGSDVRIVAARQSRVSPDMLWVACSNGTIYHIDWALSAAHHKRKKLRPLSVPSSSCTAMALLEASVDGKAVDILLVAERQPSKSAKSTTATISAYEGEISKARHQQPLRLASVKGSERGITVLEVCQESMTVVGAADEMVCVATLKPVENTPLGGWKPDSYTFDAPEPICTLDVRHHVSARKKSRFLNVIAGSVHGGIFMYDDVLGKLSRREMATFQARKFHWHRRAVHALKWSRDGRYMISGGSEHVLVLWQLETGKQDYLPHLPASIENITISANGSSYVLHLDDNSAMVLSTAEMKPTSYVAGIQSIVANAAPSKDQLVKRVWQAIGRPVAPIPAAIHPKDPSKLHLCVGTGQQASTSGSSPATPWLQSFDLEAFRTHSRHAIARTHPTDKNVTSKGYPIVEPRVTHLRFSADGNWLATVDEWDPSPQDLHDMAAGTRDLLKRQRHEVHLKFWKVGESGDFALVSRINSPHATTCAEAVFDLAARGDGARFATVGGDGLVRTWRPLIREQDGVRFKDADGQDTHKWVPEIVSDLGSSTRSEVAASLGLQDPASQVTGSLVYSDDGSTLFAAYGNFTDGAVHVVDTATGQVRHTMLGLWEGSICRMAFLSSYLFTMSGHFRVWDVVSDELCYGLELPDMEQEGASRAFLQIAMDRVSGCVAVAVPISSLATDVAIFAPTHNSPVFHQTLETTVTALVESAATGGFIVLDDMAQVSTLTEVGERGGAVRVAQTLEEMRLDAEEDKAPVPAPAVELDGEGEPSVEGDDAMEVDADADADADADGDGDVTMNGDDDDDDMEHAAVTGREAFSNLFDATPVFAVSSVEDLFYQVAGLVSQKPITT